MFERAKERGWIRKTVSSPRRDERMKAWDDIPEDERPFQRRLMEVAPGSPNTATFRWAGSSMSGSARLRGEHAVSLHLG